MRNCWAEDPLQRPTFSVLRRQLEQIMETQANHQYTCLQVSNDQIYSANVSSDNDSISCWSNCDSATDLPLKITSSPFPNVQSSTSITDTREDQKSRSLELLSVNYDARNWRSSLCSNDSLLTSLSIDSPHQKMQESTM